MGWDITYHPIRNEEIQTCYFDCLKHDEHIDEVIRKYDIQDSDGAQYKKIIAKGKTVDTKNSFNGSHGFYLAIVQGFLREYFYIRGGAFSFLIEDHPSFFKYCKRWEEILPSEYPNQQIYNGLPENYTCGVYLPPGGVKALLADIQHDPETARIVQEFYSHERIKVFTKALQYAFAHDMGLIEATEVIFPDPLDPNKGTVCYSNIHHCDTEGVLLYQTAALEQLKELTKKEQAEKDAKLPVDYTLTPENCAASGYEWYQDHIYDPEAPKGANDDFKELIQDGWKLGAPASKNSLDHGGIGLYKPNNTSVLPS